VVEDHTRDRQETEAIDGGQIRAPARDPRKPREPRRTIYHGPNFQFVNAFSTVITRPADPAHFDYDNDFVFLPAARFARGREANNG
jgi:hypothetical protein